MIILNNIKRNTKFKEIIQNYVKICNFGLLECPHCRSTHMIKWGTYERNVIFFNENGIILESFLLKVQRVKCKSCNKTHALLPFGIIPYKQFSDEVISKILLDLLSSNIDDVSSKYSIDSSVINRWMHQLKKFHLPKISTLTTYHNISDALVNFLSDIYYKVKYIIINNKCFMQIKSGVLGISPS